MTCVIIDWHWRWVNSLIVKEEYISDIVLEHVPMAWLWSFREYQELLFGSRFSLHLVYGFTSLAAEDNLNFLWQLSNFEEILNLRNLLLKILGDIWAYTLHWCNLLMTIICFPNRRMNLMKLCLEWDILHFCVDLIRGRKILSWFSHWLRNCNDSRWQLGVAEIILIITVKWWMPKLMVDCS